MDESRSEDVSPDRRLIEVLGDLAIEMQAQVDGEAILSVISAAATQNVPGASWSGISLIDSDGLRPVVPTDPVAEKIDRLQTELAEGPALRGLREQGTVHIPDLALETRWPSFASTAAELGVHCMLSFRLFIESGSIGALNIYGATPHAFTRESIVIGEVIAQHAAVALAAAAAEDQFQNALASRDVIGQAKGILMHRDNVDGLRAFALLVRASQETNTKLADVARFLVNEHERQAES